MATTQYKGARYVPLFATPLEWDVSKEYEALTIVLYKGNSYTSRQAVPAGTDINNDEYWAQTGNFNAQIERYRDIVETYDGRIKQNASDITSLKNTVNSHTTQINVINGDIDEIDDELLAIKANIAGMQIKNVADYGAIGDGTTDDTQALQEAINGGGYIFLPKGTYRTTGPLSVKTGTYIQGYNNADIVVDGDHSAFDILAQAQGDTRYDITFDRLRIWGKNASANPTQVQNGIYIGETDSFTGTHIWNVYVNQCHIHDLTGAGIQIHGASAGGSIAGHGHPEVTITNCKIEKCLWGIYNSGSETITQGCIIEDNKNQGIGITNGSRRVIIDNCVLNNNNSSGGGYGGIAIDNSDQVIVSNCILTDNKAPQINMYCTTGPAENVVITGCVMICAGFNAVSIGSTSYNANVSITGCVEQNASTALAVFGNSTLSQSGNYFHHIGNADHQNLIKSHIVNQYPLTNN